jgi:hypothetical protein
MTFPSVVLILINDVQGHFFELVSALDSSSPVIMQKSKKRNKKINK